VNTTYLVKYLDYMVLAVCCGAMLIKWGLFRSVVRKLVDGKCRGIRG